MTPEEIRQQNVDRSDEYQPQSFQLRPRVHQTDDKPETPAVENEHPTSEPPRRRRSKPKKEPTVALYLKVPADVARNLKLKACAEDCTISEIAAQSLKLHCGEWTAPYQRSA